MANLITIGQNPIKNMLKKSTFTSNYLFKKLVEHREDIFLSAVCEFVNYAQNINTHQFSKMMFILPESKIFYLTETKR